MSIKWMLIGFLLMSAMPSASATVGGREVKAIPSNMLRSVAVEGNGDKGTVHFFSRDVKVTKAEISVAGKPPIAIPVECQVIELRERGSTVRIYFDGKEAKN